MDTEQFMKIARNRLIRCEYVLQPKGEEYSRGDDRLHNFKGAAEITGETPEEALEGMWLKHVQSVRDIIQDLPNLPDEKTMDEKFVDAINYIILLEALIRERMA